MDIYPCRKSVPIIKPINGFYWKLGTDITLVGELFNEIKRKFLLVKKTPKKLEKTPNFRLSKIENFD